MNGATDRHSLREIGEEERADVCAMVQILSGSRMFFRMFFWFVISLRFLLRFIQKHAKIRQIAMARHVAAGHGGHWNVRVNEAEGPKTRKHESERHQTHQLRTCDLTD